MNGISSIGAAVKGLGIAAGVGVAAPLIAGLARPEHAQSWSRHETIRNLAYGEIAGGALAVVGGVFVLHRPTLAAAGVGAIIGGGLALRIGGGSVLSHDGIPTRD